MKNKTLLIPGREAMWLSQPFIADSHKPEEGQAQNVTYDSKSLIASPTQLTY